MDMIKEAFAAWERHKDNQLQNMKKVFKTNNIEHVRDVVGGCIYKMLYNDYMASKERARSVEYRPNDIYVYLQVSTYDYYSI